MAKPSFQMRIVASDCALDDLLRAAMKGVTDAGLARPMAGRTSKGKINKVNYDVIRSSGMPYGMEVRSVWGGPLMKLSWADGESCIGYSGDVHRVYVDFGRDYWMASRSYDAVVAALREKKGVTVSGFLEPKDAPIVMRLPEGNLGYA